MDSSAKNDTNKVMNPITNRLVRVGSTRYWNLVKAKTIKPVDPVESESDDEQIVSSPIVSQKHMNKTIKKKVILVAQKNKKKLTQMSQEDSDAHLKKLIYNMLITDKPKPEKKSKSKKYVVESSSDDSSSDSDSD
jgi:isopropylmalate/homocitrate/citramalate synthase